MQLATSNSQHVPLMELLALQEQLAPHLQLNQCAKQLMDLMLQMEIAGGRSLQPL
jgi:hypothetical protein